MTGPVVSCRYLLLALAGVAVAFCASSDQETPTFRVGVAVVRIDAQVLDENRVVKDLAREDFEIYDEGVRQEIAYFAREREPLSLMLLLDVSGSMQTHLRQMASKAQAALDHLKSDDQVGITLFSKHTKLVSEFADDRAKIRRLLDAAVWDESLGIGTEINAAVLTTAKYIEERRPTGRRAILIVTDNLSLGYQLRDAVVIRGLHVADTVLHAIVVGHAKRPVPPPSGRYLNPDFTPADVYNLAEETGGEAIKAERADRAFEDMMERVRSRYSIHYSAPQAQPGEFRNVRVALAPTGRQRYPRAVIRARKGYHAKS